MYDDFKSFVCLDCGMNTLFHEEYYMVSHDLWESVQPNKKGMLCIGCLEERLGRQLFSSDFTKCKLNTSNRVEGSERLRNRLARTVKVGSL